MSAKTIGMDVLDRKYYILDLSSGITPIENYRFNKGENYLRPLVKDECSRKKSKTIVRNPELKKIINEMGFGWEPLSEPGQMRQTPYATIIMEAIERYSWLAVEGFSKEQNFPIHRISGGELFDLTQSELRRQIALISQKPALYGTDYYNVTIKGKKLALRYSSCTQKLSIVERLNLQKKDFPIGLFEISKSYRFEKEEELQLCNRIRSFHLPELHIITDGVDSSLKIALSAHLKILENIKMLGPNYELLCSVTNDFFKKNFYFLKSIVQSIKKPLLLAVYNKNVPCEDGVEIDIEYKTFDASGSPVEFSTFQVDDGTTGSAFNAKYRLNRGSERPISTIHIVFNSSVERFAYLLLCNAIKKKGEDCFEQLPFWVAPIQVRIIAHDESSLDEAKRFAEELSALNFRVDLDDRNISYNLKKNNNESRWVPYLITIRKDGGKVKICVKNKRKRILWKTMKRTDLIKEMSTEQYRNIIVPRYSPMLLSQKLKME